MSRTEGFTQAAGRWMGTAEVYGGDGRFLGNATDRRHVTQVVGEDRVRIELSFIGPLKFAGHYFIEDHKTHRLYQGPINVGYAETLANNLIDANAYWAVTGLTQRFFLMILPDGNKQMSLGLMSRGEKLMYVVLGEYNRVAEGTEEAAMPPLASGTHYDLQADPAAGRGKVLLHRPGVWAGELQTLDGNLESLAPTRYREQIEVHRDFLNMEVQGTAFDDGARQTQLKTNGWEAWSGAGDLVGSYSLSGGRALSGHFHHLPQNLRVWRREVVSHAGDMKFVLHTWYRGSRRIGVQFGALYFDPA